MSDPAPLTAYDRFVWRRLSEVCRAWRQDPRRDKVIDVDKVGRLAATVSIPFADGDQRRGQVVALVDAVRDFGLKGMADKNRVWPAMAAGLAAIDRAVISSLALVPPAERPGARMADEKLDAGKLPYWLE